MPQALREEAEEVLLEPEPLDLQFNEARYVTTPNDAALWVVPGSGILCIFRAVKMAASCSPAPLAFHRGIVLELFKLDEAGHPTRFTALGIAPDGVESMVGEIGKTRRKIPVVGNAYFTEARDPINRLRPINRAAPD
jgi:hypothetical protein